MISASTLKKSVQDKRVLIDSNIIIYLTDSIQPYEPLSQLLFKMVEDGAVEAVISILSISEVMQGPLRKGCCRIAMEVRDYLANFPNCQCQEINFKVLEKVGRDDRFVWKGLRAVDSLIVASGIVSKVDLFISNDRHFRKSLLPEMLVSFDK